MAFGETTSGDTALAVVRMQRKLEALSAEIESLKKKEKLQDVRRALDNAKKPITPPKGDKGERGPQGQRGPVGPMPDHRWRGSVLSFQRPDGKFGLGVDLRGPAGASGGSSVVGGGKTSGGATYPAGGGQGQVLAKSSSNDNDVAWVDPVSGVAIDVDPTKADYVFPTSDPQIELAINTLAAKVNEFAVDGFAKGDKGDPGDDAPKGFGYVQYRDDIRTEASPLGLSADTETSLLINESTVLDGLQGDFSGHDFISSGLFDPKTAGDTYRCRLRLAAKPSVANTDVRVEFDIGGAVGVVDGDTKVAEVAGQGQRLFFTFDFFAGSTLVANNGTFKITAENDCDIYDVYFVVFPQSSAA